MHLLLSGEGRGDIGECQLGLDRCDSHSFCPGPMSIIINQLLNNIQSYDSEYLDPESELVSYVSESGLAAHYHGRTRGIGLPGKKRAVETRYYYNNARSLAQLARAKSEELGSPVIAILFRDADGTASAERGHWEAKRQSMLAGFAAENLQTGVAMIPKPKSEAWLLCAVKPNPYQHCQLLENESGNDRSANPLKRQLENALEGQSSAQEISDKLSNGDIDVLRIDMPSFNTFKRDLTDAFRLAR